MFTFHVEQPCDRVCDVGWCSLACFLRRGYLRGPDQKWLRNENGEILRENHPVCDWNPREKTPEEEQEYKDWIKSQDEEEADEND